MKRSATEQLGGDLEQYPTPNWVTKRLIEADVLPSGGQWLEPFAGPQLGIVRSVHREFQSMGAAPPRWTAVELDAPDGWVSDAPSVTEAVRGDVFEVPLAHDHFSIALTNPPYTETARALVKMRSLADMVVMLLPMQWGASAVTSELLRDHPPARKLVVPDRIQFLDPTKWFNCQLCKGVGKIDGVNTECIRCGGKGLVRATSPSQTHAWWCWYPGRWRGPCLEEVLPTTPDFERAWPGQRAHARRMKELGEVTNG